MLFYDRDDILEQIVSGNQVLINICGEPGIGKTTLLLDVKSKLETQDPPLQVFLIDMKRAFHEPSPMVAILRDLELQYYRGAPPHWTDLHLEANKLVTQLIGQKNCCILFDSTDALHANHDFWDWLENDLLNPLIEDGSVRLVFAGQRFAPFIRHPERDTVRIITVNPIHDSKDLIHHQFQACWLLKRFNLLPSDLEELVKTVVRLSLNHPAMIDQLTTYICKNFNGVLNEHFIRELYCKVIWPYTNQTLLAGIDEAWKEILKWNSPIKHFNQVFLWNYLRGVAPHLARRVPPENDMGPLLRQYFDAIFLLNIHGIIHKDRAENYFSECIRWFLFQSLLYLEPENLIKAYLAAISTCDEMAQSVVYDKNAYELYKGQASEHRNELVNECHILIANWRKLALEATANPEECALYTELADRYEQECNKSHEGIEKEAQK